MSLAIEFDKVSTLESFSVQILYIFIGTENFYIVFLNFQNKQKIPFESQKISKYKKMNPAIVIVY